MNQTSPSDQTSPTQRATPEQRAAVHQVLADEDTYNRLYRGITLWVFRLTDARTREEAHTQAEEILQEAVVQAFAKLDTYDPARPVVNWLLGFAINIIRQMKRRQGRELNTRRREHTRTHIVRQMRRRQDREAARSDYTSSDTEELSNRLHGQAAQELLDLVSEPDQQVLRLAIVEGLSGRELAANLGISEGAARVRLHRAKQQLRRAYSQLP